MARHDDDRSVVRLLCDFAKSRNERHPLARETFGRFMVGMGAVPARPLNEVVGERIADESPTNRRHRAKPNW